MKRLLTFSKIFGIIAIVYMIVGCKATTTANNSAISQSKKEMMLTQAGFWAKSVTTPKQQQRLAQLPANVVSSVKYNGKLYYVYPTEKKNQILVGKQAQYDAYKKARQAQGASQQTKLAAENAQEQNQIMNGDPEWSGETVGPRHILVQQYDGFGPLDPMQGD
jgi:hypothetical protein